MPDWIKDDGTLEQGWQEKVLPEELRKEASLADFKTLGAIAKAWVDTKKAQALMVKLPATEPEQREFLAKHFKPVLDADAEAKKKADEDAAAKAKQDSGKAAAEAAEQQVKAAQGAVKTLLGGTEGKDFAVNMELCRRAIRGEHVSQTVKDLLATAAGVEWAKVTDDQIKDIVARDPLLAEWSLKIGQLTRDGRLESGDGHSNKVDERVPAYPYNPEYYNSEPDTNPEKQWFIARGAQYDNGKYVGGFATLGR